MKIEVLMAYLDSSESFIGELWTDEGLVAEVNRENGELTINLHSPAGGKAIGVPYEELLQALEKGRRAVEGGD